MVTKLGLHLLQPMLNLHANNDQNRVHGCGKIDSMQCARNSGWCDFGKLQTKACLIISTMVRGFGTRLRVYVLILVS